MKYFLTLLAIFSIVGLYSQDTIYFKNKEKQVAQLLEVNPDNIKYKKWDNQSGPTYSVVKSDVELIVLSNGKKEVFSATPARPVSTDTSATIAKAGTVAAISTEKPKTCDTIFFRSGKKQAVTIYDLAPTEIKYKPITNPDGPVYKALKSDVKEIVFSTGMKQSFNEAPAQQYSGSSLSAAGMTMKGIRDAKTYYKNGGGSIGTGITAVLFPPAGLIPAVICSLVPPKEHNLGYPDDNLWQNKDYRTAYTKQAYRIKLKRVWLGFGIGATAGILAGILLAK